MYLAIQFDEKLNKFFAIVEAKESAIQFEKRAEGVLDMVSTYVPPSLRHRGIAEALVKHALGYAREHDFKVIASCSYVANYLSIHPEWEDIVAGAAKR